MGRYPFFYDYHLVSPCFRAKIDLRDFKDDIKEAIRRVVEGRSITYTRYQSKVKQGKRPKTRKSYFGISVWVFKQYYRVYSYLRLDKGFFTMVGTEIAHASHLGMFVKHYKYNKDEETGKYDVSNQLFIQIKKKTQPKKNTGKKPAKI